MTCGNSAVPWHGSRFLMVPFRKAISRLRLIAVLSGVVLLLWGPIQAGYAETDTVSLKASLAMLPQGEVMANNGQEIFIDNTRYLMLPSVLVTDDEGRPRDLKEFVRGTQVRFHLRKDKIDQLIMMLPR